MKISNISKLEQGTDREMKLTRLSTGSFQSDVHIEATINQILIAITTFNVQLFDELFTGAVKRLGLKKDLRKESSIRFLYVRG
jgi:hypothetical protein